MKTIDYRGFIVPLPAHLKPKLKNATDVYAFSGVSVSRGEPFAAVVRVLRVPGFITPEEFAADLASAVPPQVNGVLQLFPADYVLGQFRYIRPDGSTATARTGDSLEIDPPELTPKRPSPPKAAEKPKENSAPPPNLPDLSM